MIQALWGAALRPTPEAFESWNRWREVETLEECGPDAHGWLPCVFRNLQDQPMEERDQKKLRGIYRYWWTKVQLLSKLAESVIFRMQEKGVDLLLIGGLATAHLVHADLGLRPVGHVELLIRPEQRGLALEVLLEAGWRPLAEIVAIELWPTCELAHEDGQRLLLHWFLCRENRWRGVDEGCWSRARPLPLPGVTARTLSASDMLLLACVRQDRLDACRLVAAADWGAFWVEVERRRLVQAVLPCLHFVRDQVGWAGLIPNPPPVRTGWWGFLVQPYDDYRVARTGVGFLDFLRARWGLRSRWQVLPRALKLVWQRMLGG